MASAYRYNIETNEPRVSALDADGNPIDKREPAKSYLDGVPLRDITAKEAEVIKPWTLAAMVESGLYTAVTE